MTGPADAPESWPVEQHRILATGRVCTFVEDEVRSPSGELLTRQYLGHPGAVGILAVDDRDRVCCVRQYRAPMNLRFVEPPAGLLDHVGEDPLEAARRELAEEVELQASSWQVLVDFCSSPGGSTETSRVYLATGLSAAPRPDGFVVEGEESHMDLVWVPLDDLYRGVLDGSLSSPLLVAGVPALVAARALGTPLRPADAPWPVRRAVEGRLAEVLPGAH